MKNINNNNTSVNIIREVVLSQSQKIACNRARFFLNGNTVKRVGRFTPPTAPTGKLNQEERDLRDKGTRVKGLVPQTPPSLNKEFAKEFKAIWPSSDLLSIVTGEGTWKNCIVLPNKIEKKEEKTSTLTTKEWDGLMPVGSPTGHFHFNNFFSTDTKVGSFKPGLSFNYERTTYSCPSKGVVINSFDSKKIGAWRYNSIITSTEKETVMTGSHKLIKINSVGIHRENKRAERMLSLASRVKVSKKNTTTIEGKCETEKIKARIEQIKRVKKGVAVAAPCYRFVTSPPSVFHIIKGKAVRLSRSTEKVNVNNVTSFTSSRFTIKMTPKAKVQRVIMTTEERMERGINNIQKLLSRIAVRANRTLTPAVHLDSHIERVEDFLFHGDPITVKGDSQIKVSFCDDGIELIGHAPTQRVNLDGEVRNWSYECEFVSTLAYDLKRRGYATHGVGGDLRITIGKEDAWYNKLYLIFSALAEKCANIVVETADRMMSAVLGKSSIGLQAFSIMSVRICADENLTNKIKWTPCLYINGKLAVEQSGEFEDLSKLYTYSNNTNSLKFVYSRYFAEGIEYKLIELNELNNVTHYYNYFDSILLLKRGNIVFVAYEKGAKWCDDVNVKKLIYASDFNYYQSQLRLLANSNKLADTNYYANYECVKILVECYFEDIYDVTEGTWADWTIYENAQAIIDKANLTNEQMIKILKESNFERNNPLTSLLFTYLTAEMPETEVIGEIFGDVDRQYIYKNYGVCVLNSIVPMGEVRGDLAWQEQLGILKEVGGEDGCDGFVEEDNTPDWDDIDYSGGYNCSETAVWARQYQRDNMFHGLTDTILVHCTTDVNVNSVVGEVCGSLWAKGATSSFKDSGLIFAPVKESISVIFNQDVWSKIVDGVNRTLSCCKYIRETDISINAKEAIHDNYYNEVWFVPNKTKVVSGFYKDTCDPHYIYIMQDICFRLGIPCIELKSYNNYDALCNYCNRQGEWVCCSCMRAYNNWVTEYNWNLIKEFAFKSDYLSYEQIKEEEKALEYSDKYEYVEEYFDAQAFSVSRETRFNGLNLQLFAEDKNTGVAVPEPNGDVRREVQKETSSHKEGVNKMTTNINTSNNNTNKVDCQTSIWHGYDNQDYLVPGMVVLEALRDCRGKLVYRKDHELSPLEVKQMLLNYFRNVPEVNKKSVETEFISHIFTTANSLNYFDAMAKPYEVKLVTVPTTHLKDNNYIIEAAMKDVNKNCLEDIFKAQLIIGSESALAKLKGCKVETYGELLSSMIECDPQNKTMSFVDISSAAKVVARLKSPRNCNEVISKGRHGDKQARVLIVPNSQQAGYTWLDEKFAQDFKLEVTKKYKMTGSDVIFFTENGPVSAAEALDNYKQMGGDLFKGTTAHWNDAIAVIDGREFQNDWDWSVKPEIKRISSRVSKRNGAERIEYSVTIWLKGYTHPVSGCKLRGVVSAKNLMVKGKMTDFSDAIGLKSVVLVGEKIQVAVQGRDGMVKYDAIIPTEAIKFPTFIKNHMGSTFNYVMAEVWDYEENAMVWKECVEGVMELGFESPTGEGRGSYKRIHEKFVQAYGFVQATKGLKGIVPDDVIDGVVSWYEDSIKKNMSTGISLIKGIRGESNVEYKEISLDDFCKLTDGDIIGNETGYCIKSLGGNSELVKPICIPKGKLIYRFFTYCPSDVENFGKDDIVAQMTKAEDPNSIREMKGGLRQLINTLRDINADKSLPLVNEIEEARRRMVADAVEHTKDFFSASFDGGCFTVIYADWLKGDVCGLENSKHKYCSIGRQPYTNFWLNFVEVQDMETISKHSPFKISSRFSKNVVVLPFSKANPTHGDSDGDFAIIKFINDIIAKRWIESGVNSRLEKAFASQFGNPSQRKLNNLLKKVDIRKFFETKTYTHSYDELAHFFAMACQSKANTQTTTSLAYAMGIILGETIAEVNTARNEDSRLQRHIAFNGAFFKLVQDAIDGIKADASTIEIDSIRKIVVAFMQDARNMNMFFGLCNDYKVSAVTTEHQVECINKARGRILSTGHNAEKVYKAIRDIVRITSGKMDYSSIVEYKEGFDKSFNSVNPGVFNKVERFLNAIITKEPTATNYHIALSAKEELNAMGITNEMLQAGNPEAISDKERAKGATYSWISQHISKYANSEAMSCLAWEDKPKEIAKYVCSTEFEKTYEDYNEEGEKVMSRIGRLASLAITIIGGKVSANTGVSGKLFSKLQANASGNKVQDAKFNRVETRRVIGLICLAIALNKGQLRNKDFWYSIGSRLLVNVNGFAALRSIAEKKFAETSKKIQDANHPEAKTITIEDAVAIASTIVTADNGIDLQLFASNPVRSNSKSSKTATTKRERITLKKATRGVVLSELAKLNRHSIERGRGPLPVEVQSWFLEHRMGFDWSIGKCSTREDVHCSYLCKETSTCYYCMIYKHNNCNQIYPATIFPITGEKDYYLAKNTQGYSIINFIK